MCWFERSEILNVAKRKHIIIYQTELLSLFLLTNIMVVKPTVHHV
jgi:hypothetical protein